MATLTVRRGGAGLILTLLVTLACSSTPSILTAERTRRASQSPAVVATDTIPPAPKSTSGIASVTPGQSTAFGERIGPGGFPADVDPLTGLKVESPALLERRPVGLEIANFPVEVRPQSGLSMADLAFEHDSGQGTTRILALFYGKNASSAGPITSGQWVDGELVRLFNGILGVNGAIPEVDDTLSSQLPGRLFYAGPSLCPGLCPVGQGNEGSAFADTGALSRFVNGLTNGGEKPNLDGYVFDTQAPPGGEPADHLEVTYANLNAVAWDFDPTLGAYVRLQDDAAGHLAPATDALTGEQLAVPNVIVLFARHEAVQPNMIDISLWFEPSRPFLLLRDGQLYRGSWSITDQDSPLQWLDANGLPIPLKPGATWVQIVSLVSDVFQPEPGAWQVDFVH